MDKILKTLLINFNKKRSLSSISIFFIILIPTITTIVVFQNSKAGIYPSSADSIIIPIFNSIIHAIFYSFYLFILNIIALRNYKYSVKVVNIKSTFWLIIGLILCIPGILLCIIIAIYWLDSYHLPIAMVYIFGIYVIINALIIIINKGGSKQTTSKPYIQSHN